MCDSLGFGSDSLPGNCERDKGVGTKRKNKIHPESAEDAERNTEHRKAMDPEV
jgi:hypothetical protein